MPKVIEAPALSHWVWTCRAGFEPQLFEELAWAKAKPAMLAPALITSETSAKTPPVFARMGFAVTAAANDPGQAAAALPAEPAHVQVWVPDSDVGNRLTSEAAHWAHVIEQRRTGLGDLSSPWRAFEAGAWLPQVCLLKPGLAAIGLVRARDAFTLSAGGRQRMKRSADAPSRAAMKLDEALEWLALTPGKGDLCVDLGAAPGGWTRQLIGRGARVIAVDPANLAPELATHGRVKHAKVSAFEFEPPQPADWLFCDMAWRPLEVAQLLAKWARRGWARQLVTNFKLPMKDKLPTVRRVLAVLEEGGWRAIMARQLYHDRDEITVTAAVL